MCVYIYVCICLCICVCIPTYTHTNIYIPTLSYNIRNHLINLIIFVKQNSHLPIKGNKIYKRYL